MEEKRMEFTIKRGMVFYLEDQRSESVPKSKRPYMVLSNNKCNASASMVHVAPILIREYDPKKWYCVPFKSTCNRDAVVDISSIQLIDKALCTEAAYSEAVSNYTYSNQALLDAIKTAVKRQFGVDDDYYNDYRAAKTAATAIQQRQEMPSIHLTINLNGVPVNASVNAETVAETIPHEDVVIDEPITEIEEPVVEETEEQNSTKIAKAVKDVRKLFDTVEKEEQSENKLSKNYVLTEESAKVVENYIRKNHKCFGGDMCGSTIAAHFGLADSTINRRVKKMLGKSSRSYLAKKKKKSVRAHLPENLYNQFVKDYADYGCKYCIKTYAEYGFTKASQVYNLVKRIQARLENKEKAVVV